MQNAGLSRSADLFSSLLLHKDARLSPDVMDIVLGVL